MLPVFLNCNSAIYSTNNIPSDCKPGSFWKYVFQKVIRDEWENHQVYVDFFRKVSIQETRDLLEIKNECFGIKLILYLIFDIYLIVTHTLTQYNQSSPKLHIGFVYHETLQLW